MLETIRQYALECLIQSGEAETTHWQHANFFLALAEKAEPQLRGAEQVDWLNRLETEHNNLRKALIWFREQARDKIQGLRLAIALYWFWGVHSFWSEGVTWLTQFLDLTKTSSHTAVRAKALNCAGHLAWLRQDFALAHTLHTESLAICRKLEDQQGIADALFGLGRVARLQGNYAAAGTFYEESLAIQRELGNKTGIADTLLYLGAGVTFYEDLTLAQSLLEESLAMWRELKVKSGIAPTLNKLGRIAQLQGNYGEAKSLYLEGLKLFRELGDKFGPAYTLHDLGCVALYQDDRQRANSYFKESLALYQELKLKDGIVDCLTGLTKIAMMNGQLERAARLCGAIETLLEFLDDQHTSDKVEYTRMAATVHVHLDEALYRSAWVEGQAMTMKQAIDYALSGEVWV
jgi:tetratricopeptide (TPR) repeat protein